MVKCAALGVGSTEASSAEIDGGKVREETLRRDVRHRWSFLNTPQSDCLPVFPRLLVALEWFGSAGTTVHLFVHHMERGSAVTPNVGL